MKALLRSLQWSTLIIDRNIHFFYHTLYENHRKIPKTFAKNISVLRLLHQYRHKTEI